MKTNSVSGTGLPVFVTSQQYGRGVALRHGQSPALQVDDDSTTGFHQLVRLDTEHVVPRSRRRPHLGPMQQIRIDEHAQMRLVTEGRHATIGL